MMIFLGILWFLFCWALTREVVAGESKWAKPIVAPLLFLFLLTLPYTGWLYLLHKVTS